MAIIIEVKPDRETLAQLARIEDGLGQVLAALSQIGVSMSDLTDAVDAVKSRVTTVVENQRQQIKDLSDQLIQAMSNDAADAEAIAAKQSELEALNAEIDSQVEELNAFDPLAGGEPEPSG